MISLPNDDLGNLSQAEFELGKMLEELYADWQPHSWQKDVGNLLFYKKRKNIFICAGRNGGKTENSAKCTGRWGKQFPATESYIFGPLQNQIKEILWASKRIQHMIPEHWKAGENNTEMRITLKNGSFIKLDGSDNEEARRGIKPGGLIVYDEFKDMKLSFVNAMDDNRAAKDCPAIYIGTPPEFHNHFVDFMEFAKNDPDWDFIHAPSWLNPHISKEFLERKKRQYLAMNDEESWLREYEALFVKGGKKHIFPQFLKMKPTRLDDMNLLLKEFILICGFDPAATSVFGGLFVLFHPYSKKVIVFDEIYEADPLNMTSRKIYATAEEKIALFRNKVKDVRFVYDSAAAYFRSEIGEIPNNKWWLENINKNEFGIEGHINITRSVMNQGLLYFTPNCEKFIWEMENYIKDEKGRVPDKHDHLINTLWYILVALGFNLEDIIIKQPDPDTLRRGYSMNEDLRDSMNFKEID